MFFFNQKTAYEMRISDWSSDVCSSDLERHHENWGAVWEGEDLSLAPSFDHGAAMARNLSDEQRDERLHARDRNRRIPHFARRARSALYANPTVSKPLHTLDAWRMFAERVPVAAAEIGRAHV